MSIDRWIFGCTFLGEVSEEGGWDIIVEQMMATPQSGDTLKYLITTV